LEDAEGTICHDLRLPLIVIERTRQKLLKEVEPLLDQQLTESLDTMGKSISWMNRLIDGLAEYRAIGRGKPDYATVSVQHIVISAIDAISATFHGREVILDIGDLPPVFGDDVMLRRAFTNLISNAFKFTQYRETTRIEVGAIRQPQETIYYVKDNGEGFGAQDAKDLFTPFRRLRHAHEFQGTGMGLAIVKRVADLHGGRVWAVSEAGEGALFCLALPTSHDNGSSSVQIPSLRTTDLKEHKDAAKMSLRNGNNRIVFTYGYTRYFTAAYGAGMAGK
jgi:light-regulated signal transduction histidine kinase (bacteriophytochrome)